MSLASSSTASVFDVPREFLGSHAVAHVLNSKPMWQPDVIALPESVPIEVALHCMHRSNIFRSPVLAAAEATATVHAGREALHKSQQQQQQQHKETPPAWARQFVGVISVADLLSAIVQHPVWSELRLNELARGSWPQQQQQQQQQEPPESSTTSTLAHRWTAAHTAATTHAIALHWTAPLRDALHQPLRVILPAHSLTSLVFAESHDALTAFCQVTDDSLNTVLVRDALHLVDQRPPPPPILLERLQQQAQSSDESTAGDRGATDAPSAPSAPAYPAAIVWQPYFSAAAGVSPHVFVMSNFDVLAYLCQHLDRLGAPVHMSLIDLGVVQLPQAVRADVQVLPAAASTAAAGQSGESRDTNDCHLFGPAEGVTLQPSSVIAITSAYSALRGFCTLLNLRKAHISALPIVDADTHELVGTLSVNDARSLTAERLHLLLKPVLTFLQSASDSGSGAAGTGAGVGGQARPDPQSRMSWTFHETCAPTDRLSDVMLRMKASHVHRVWVCDERRRVIGVISVSDCLALLSGSAITRGVNQLNAVSAMKMTAPALTYSRMEM